MKTENYIKVLKASIEIQQKREEIKKLLTEISKSLTMEEVIKRNFCRESAKNAWAVFKDGVLVQSKSHVTAAVIYEDVDISLHCDPANRPDLAMERVLEQIETNDIVKAIK